MVQCSTCSVPIPGGEISLWCNAVPAVFPSLVERYPCGAMQYLQCSHPWWRDIPVVQCSTCSVPIPGGEISLWCNAVTAVFPSLVERYPCGAMQYLQCSHPWWRDIPVVQCSTCSVPIPGGEISLWCNAVPAVFPSLVERYPCGAMQYLQCSHPWWRDIPVVQCSTCSVPIPGGEISLWCNAVPAVFPSLVERYPCGAMQYLQCSHGATNVAWCLPSLYSGGYYNIHSHTVGYCDIHP